jgi:hypothetical protein
VSTKVDNVVDALGKMTLEEIAELDSALNVSDGGPQQAPAAVVASGGGSRIRRMAHAQGRAKPSPEIARRGGGAELVAARSWRGVKVGETINDRYSLANGITDLLETSGPIGRTLVASARWEYPEERRLTEDQAANARKLDAVTHPTALVASGGICSPVDVDHSVPTWSAADRPVRDGLPAFQANRGGLVYVASPTMASLSGATEVWTEATDANPGSATKPVLQIACASPTTVYVDAVPTRLGFGNMQARFAPEYMAANVDLAAAAAARIAENNLLTHIAAACTADVTTAILLGATRDCLTAVGQAVAGLRSVNRISSTLMLTAIFPAWVKELLRVDLAREIGHAQNDDWNSFALQDEQIDDLLKARGVNPIWHVDGQSSSVAGGVAQLFTAQSASGAIETFPTKMVWYLFPEGSIQFLDGGRLDLGIVRDSVLDSTNDFELFVEPFEAIAFRGFTGAATQFVSSLCANGASAGTTSTTSDCA